MRVSNGDSVRRDEVLFNVVDLQSMADGTDADAQLLTATRTNSPLSSLRATRTGSFRRRSRRFDRASTTLSQQPVEIGGLIAVQTEQNALADDNSTR